MPARLKGERPQPEGECPHIESKGAFIKGEPPHAEGKHALGQGMRPHDEGKFDLVR